MHDRVEERLAVDVVDAYGQQRQGGPMFGITAEESQMCRRLAQWHWYRQAREALLVSESADPTKVHDFAQRREIDEPTLRPSWWPRVGFPPGNYATDGGLVAAVFGWLWWHRGAGRNRPRDEVPSLDEVPTSNLLDDQQGPVWAALQAVAERNRRMKTA